MESNKMCITLMPLGTLMSRVMIPQRPLIIATIKLVGLTQELNSTLSIRNAVINIY